MARITCTEEGVHRVELPERGLRFYWKGEADDNLYFLIEQEWSQANPHCYTTPPIRLDSRSRVLDVGACEGLFAFRILRDGLAGEVVCFEPDPVQATLVWRGAVENRVAKGLRVEPVAVSDRSGPVRILPGASPDSLRIERCEGEGGRGACQAVSLDDYLDNRGLRLAPRDLIKIDAEGADLDALRGASTTIARDRPQIAVATYHQDSHAPAILELLSSLNSGYRFRIKGFSHWTQVPRPVLLQASSREA